ncbi:MULTISPECIES: Crp/Fnr family transcriptional regulator [Variovorax]|uniref:Crp/Fnr family transcriptional regulator n=1 Tax=Variovorax atrisoli TaxID=3394203 RepID=UPI001FCA0711|nr:Crp/Fnr family transcriptional regulator [Variovorax paradoxus]
MLQVIPDPHDPAGEPAALQAMEEMVRRSRWASALSHADLEHVLGSMQERQFARGGCIARAGELVEHWMALIDGFAKMSVASEDGRVSTLTGVSAGVWFGEGSLFKHEARRYDVFALRPARVALMPRRTFEWLRGTSVPFNHYLQDLLNARLSLFIGALEHERLLDTDARVANCLASLFNPELYPHAPRFLEVGQIEIGLLANVSRQRVNVALQRFQALGLIRLEKRGLTVLDPAGLRGYRATCNCALAEEGGRHGSGAA